MSIAKSARGNVGVEEYRGKLRLRLPRLVTQAGQNRYLNTGLDGNDINRRRVDSIANWIEEEIITGQLDPTLERYREKLESYKQPQLTIVKPNTPQTNLMELWERYCEYMKPQLATTTYRKDYARKYHNHIKALPTKDLSQAIAIRDYLLTQLTPNAAKRVLTYLAACCKWAVSSGLAKDNPFAGMSEDIKLPKHDSDAIDPFSRVEMNTIIKAFEDTRPHYAPFVKFLFWTGCRTGEAIALQWRHINSECTQITFAESYDSALGIRKGTKTGKSRKFPCNNQVRELLLSIRPINPDPEQSVFTSPTGGIVNSTRFSNQVWKGGRVGQKCYNGVIQQLMDDGKIERYRCPYNTRHTFITLMLEQGLTVTTVAKLVGNSPEIILKHYAGNTVPLTLPEI
ncbi:MULTISPECIES: tyrosine recombinase XerC [Nostoc]|uniref:Site-specific integrase n=1 Tax=Nostoc paludosum FACHB-159 TaxID=2692908 RepID=A0ABR8KJ21_9NOSO|nr:MULTISPECIES: site-specific integrase [Nostoc]MBD2683238.1 site-specific integrase [Nostoc sp. FACHB-857]MBD2739565.1 site-specific integrase [Nostoc paludosum FACHB-159]